jgi:hypothetical protein
MLQRRIIHEIVEVVLPARITRGNPRGVKRKMSGCKLRNRSTQKTKALKIKTIQIIININ